MKFIGLTELKVKTKQKKQEISSAKCSKISLRPIDKPFHFFEQAE